MRRHLAMLLPRRVASWLWDLDVPLGNWAPHVFARAMGVTEYERVTAREGGEDGE